MKTTQALFQPCPKCGRTKSARAKSCGLCATKGRKNVSCQIIVCTCLACEREFDMPAWRVNQGRGVFCSRKCVNTYLGTIKGPAHQKYQGRNAPQRYTGTSWKAARAAVIERADGKCEWCGIDLVNVKRYAIHHIIGMYQFSVPDQAHAVDNLAVICQSCHAKHHGLGTMPPKEVMPHA